MITITGDKPTPGHLFESAATGLTVKQLLEAGQYERVVELLPEAEAPGPASAAAEILAAARQLCSICSEYRTQVEWHRQAAEAASRQEQALNERLQTMLARINRCAISAPPAKTDVATGDSLFDQGWSEPPVAVGAGPSLHVCCLGSFEVIQQEQAITTWNSFKARSIFKYLLAHRGTPVAKDILMDVFWPEAEPEAARRNLHTAIWNLRQTLRQDGSDFHPIQFENDCYLLNPDMDIWLDYVEFEKYIQAGQHLEAAGQLAEAAAAYSLAESLYRGDFLGDDLYEDWPTRQRQYLRNMYLDIANRLSEYYLQTGRHDRAIALSQRILAFDNCHEEAHRRLMHCYLIQDQRSLAIRQYRACVQALQTELGVPPSAETQALHKQIMGGVKTSGLAMLETLAS